MKRIAVGCLLWVYLLGSGAAFARPDDHPVDYRLAPSKIEDKNAKPGGGNTDVQIAVPDTVVEMPGTETGGNAGAGGVPCSQEGPNPPDCISPGTGSQDGHAPAAELPKAGAPAAQIPGLPGFPPAGGWPGGSPSAPPSWYPKVPSELFRPDTARFKRHPEGTVAPGSQENRESGQNGQNAHNPEPTKQENKPSLWERLKAKAGEPFKKALRGLAVGLIGAGIIVGGALLVGAIVGTAIASPFLLGAAAVGAVGYGLYYSFTTADFNWTKGIANSALTALTVLTVGRSLGVGSFRGMLAGLRSGAGTVRGGLTAARNALSAGGVRGVFRFLKTGARSLLTKIKGTPGSIVGGIKTLIRSPGPFVSKHLWNPAIRFSFGFNLAANAAIHMLQNPGLPTTKDLTVIVAQSFLSTFVFEKLSRGLGGKFVSNFAKRTSEFLVGVGESAVVNLLKGKKNVAEQLAKEGFFKTFFVKPAAKGLFFLNPVKKLFSKARAQKNIGTTLDEVKLWGVKPVQGPQVLSPQRVQNLWKQPGAKETVEYWQSRGGTVTSRELADLTSNQKKYEELIKVQQKVTDKAANEAMKKVLQHPQVTGAEQAAGEGAKP